MFDFFIRIQFISHLSVVVCVWEAVCFLLVQFVCLDYCTCMCVFICGAFFLCSTMRDSLSLSRVFASWSSMLVLWSTTVFPIDPTGDCKEEWRHAGFTHCAHNIITTDLYESYNPLFVFYISYNPFSRINSPPSPSPAPFPARPYLSATAPSIC